VAVNHRVKRQPTEPSFRKKTADGARGGWAVPGRLGYGHMGYHGDTYREICCTSGFEATRPPCDGYLLFLTPSPGHGHARTSYTYRFSRAIGITMWYPWDVQGMHQSITIIPFH